MSAVVCSQKSDDDLEDRRRRSSYVKEVKIDDAADDPEQERVILMDTTHNTRVLVHNRPTRRGGSLVDRKPRPTQVHVRDELA